MTKRLQYYAANCFFIWTSILIFHSNRYYVGFLSHKTQSFLISLGLFYTIVGLPFHLLIPKRFVAESKGFLLYKALAKSFRLFYRYNLNRKNFSAGPESNPTKLNLEEKNILLFSLVKFFFLPMMINFLISNLTDMNSAYGHWRDSGHLFSVYGFNDFIYPLLISFFLLIDTGFFLFGYSVEAKFLKNKVRSVEPTFLGWFVALICYPPFNGILGNYIEWYQNDYRTLGSATNTAALRVFALIFWLIYISASVALGAKCSNLTNRGIVSRGPYAIIRHPAYIAKNIAWWTTVIPLLFHTTFVQSLIVVSCTSVWTYIYFMRAVTEERHLMLDPDYREYCKKVPYRFIPHLY